MEAIYLDHNATTPVRPEVAEAVAAVPTDGLANPASQHQPGQRARRLLDDARQRIAEILGGNPSDLHPDRLIFTSSGTEANNLALLGIARAGGDQPGQLVISAIEHASVIQPAEHLLEQGWRLDTLGVDAEAWCCPSISPRSWARRPGWSSVMLGNHETGVLQPVGELAASATTPACRCTPTRSRRPANCRSIFAAWAWPR